ncbi:methyl-accepting chemotaxis protein [Salinibacter ruber]|uniref:methyl-accepting chemotaxis protein n=1 Tax=Salinibacter ruber TaxID=146919 RepID=UPI002074955C|nr:methyl-accepting chemotaxis protein [Salinibacter ruber]
MQLSKITRRAAVTLTILLLVLGAGLYVNSRSAEALKSSYERQYDFQNLGQQVANASDYLTRQARLFAVTGDPKHLDKYWTEVQETQRRKTAVNELELKGASDEALQFLKEAKKASDALVKTEMQAMRLVLEAKGVPESEMPSAVAEATLTAADQALTAEEKRDKAQQLMFGEKYAAAKETIMKPTQQFRRTIEEQAAQRVASNRSWSATVRWAMVGIFILLAAGIAAILYVLRSRVTNPLRSLARQLTDSEEENVTVSVEGAREITAVAEAFNQQQRQIAEAMEALEDEKASVERRVEEAVRESEQQKERLQESVDTMLEAIGRFADGDLTVRLPTGREGAIGRLFEGFNEAVAGLRSIVGRVREAAGSTASATEQISSSSEQMAASAEEQSAQAEEVAAAVEELNQTIGENARSVQQVAEAAGDGSQQAQEGQQVVAEATGKMEEIAEEVQGTAETIERLQASSEEISQVVETIDDIAGQTNLLALNAAIEASRAGSESGSGDTGQGFGVVAEEVRQLAEETDQATTEIAEIIGEVQTEIQEAVEAARQSSANAEEGIELSREASAVLDEIVGSISRVEQMTDEIAAASEEQSTTSEEIARSVQSISTAAQESAAGVTEVSDTAGRLERLSTELEETVQQFRIEAGAGSSPSTGQPSTGQPSPSGQSASAGHSAPEEVPQEYSGDGHPAEEATL